MPCAREGSGHAKLASFCTYAVEDLEFLDTPVCIHMCVVTTHEYKTIMMIFIVSVWQITVFSYEILLTWDFSVVGFVNLKLGKFLLKLRLTIQEDFHLQKITHYAIWCYTCGTLTTLFSALLLVTVLWLLC